MLFVVTFWEVVVRGSATTQTTRIAVGHVLEPMRAFQKASFKFSSLCDELSFRAPFGSTSAMKIEVFGYVPTIARPSHVNMSLVTLLRFF